MENNQEEDHTQEEQGLGAGSLWSYFVQLKVRVEGCVCGGETKQFMFSKQVFFFLRSTDVRVFFEFFAYPYPEEPDAHVANASHRCDYKVHGDDCDQDVVQWKNL